MSHVRIYAGATEPIVLYVLDLVGAELTGATDLFVRVLRESDGFLLDHSDDTFKGSGWTSLDGAALGEIDATNAPGFYRLTGGLDSSAWTNAVADDNYHVIPIQTGATAVLPAPAELKVGQWVTFQHDVWRYYGLDPANPMEVDFALPAGHFKVPASGSIIDQSVVTVGNVSTVTRT